MSGHADILCVRGVGHSFGGFSVLKNVNFSVPHGSIVGLIGPNGSGKTTLFNIISGYIRHQYGLVAYDGQDIRPKSIQARSIAGLVRTFQTPKVFEQMTVLENIMAGACKLTRSGVIEDLLSLPRSRADMRRISALAEEVCMKFGMEKLRHDLALRLPAGQRRVFRNSPRGHRTSAAVDVG